MKADEIEQIVHKLLELKKTKSQEELDFIPEFFAFRDKYADLYKMVLSNDMDLVIFKQMMKCKRKLEQGEDKYGVDVKFGEFMAEKYVYPLVKK